MLKFLKRLFMFVKSNFLKFLIEVWEGSTNEILEESYEYINEIVHNVQNIGEYVTVNKAEGIDILIAYLEPKYGYYIYRKDIEGIKLDKGDGKAKLAFRLIKRRLIEEKKSMKKSVIKLGIELAVNRFFK